MRKPQAVVAVESWTTFPVGKQATTITKVAVRIPKGQPGGGQFHGATNFRGSVLSK
jgi:hypothetical protein